MDSFVATPTAAITQIRNHNNWRNCTPNAYANIDGLLSIAADAVDKLNAAN